MAVNNVVVVVVVVDVVVVVVDIVVVDVAGITSLLLTIISPGNARV